MLILKVSESTAARRRVPLILVDATDGYTPETGITFSAGELKVSKNGAAEGNHAGTVTEIAGGVYYYEATSGELDTVGYWSLRTVKSGVRQFVAVAQVVAIDPYDTVRLGLTALPSVAIGSAGGLLFAYTGTGVGGVTTSLGMANADVIAISGDIVAANNAEAFFDGTGYAGTNNVIPSVTTVTGNVNGSVGSVTGAVGSVTGNVGGSVASVVGSVGGNVLGSVGSLATQAKADVNAEVDSALNTAIPGSPTADSINERIATLDNNYTAARGALLDNLDATVSSRSTVTTAQVNAEVDNAIADARLDELLAADSDIDGAAPPAVGSVFHELLSKTAGSFTFDQTTDSLEALRDRGDAAWITGGDATAANQATIIAAVAAVQADTDDIQTRLPAALVAGRMASDAVAISGSTAAADSVEANIANLDATVSSRAPEAGGNIAAIKTKTDQLNFTGTDVKATLDGETVTLAAATHTGAVIPTVTTVTNPVTAGTVSDKTGYALSAAGNNAVADATLSRDVDQVEATMAVHSIGSGVLKMVGRVARSGSDLLTYRTNGTTTHMTQAITFDATLEPFTELGTAA